jgi:1-acyl-sn-glycerol-3-phosphate acyltransferase
VAKKGIICRIEQADGQFYSSPHISPVCLLLDVNFIIGPDPLQSSHFLVAEKPDDWSLLTNPRLLIPKMTVFGSLATCFGSFFQLIYKSGGLFMSVYYRSARFILGIYRMLLSRGCRVFGELPHLPGPKIIAGNHPNATDGFHFPFVFREKLHFFIQGNIFSVPFFGWLLEKSDQIPVHPDLKKAALDRACSLLKSGQTVVIFPEGRLNPDNQPVKAGVGAVWMSLMTGAAIIPVGLFVPEEYVRNLVVRIKGRLTQGRWQIGGLCYIHIGSPWLPRLEINGRLNSATVHDLTDRLMDKIRELAHLAYLAWANDKIIINN